jgi:hypothetical protein
MKGKRKTKTKTTLDIREFVKCMGAAAGVAANHGYSLKN